MITTLSAYAPMHSHNRRPAKCARCHKGLAPGAGIGWMLNGIQQQNVYLCPICSGAQAEEELALIGAAPSLDLMNLALGWGRGLGFQNEERVRRAIRNAGARGVENARLVASRLARGEVISVWQIVNLVENG